MEKRGFGFGGDFEEWVNNGHVTCNIFEKWWKILIVYGEETGRVRFSFDSNILYSLFYI